MKKTKFLVMTLFFVFAFMLQKSSAQSNIYVEVNEAVTRLYNERVNITNSYEVLKKNKQEQAYKLGKLKVDYYLVLAKNIRTYDDVDTALSATSLNNVTTGIDADGVSRQEESTFRQEAANLLKK